MSLIKAGLFSLSSSRTIAKDVTFVRGRGYKAVRKHFTPTDLKSSSQLSHRTYFSRLSTTWASPYWNLHDKLGWDFMAKVINRNSNGRNQFFRQYFQWDGAKYLTFPNNVFYTPPPLPIRIGIYAQNGIDIYLKIVRGPDAGYTLLGSPVGFGFYFFRVLVDNPNNIFHFYVDSLTHQGWTGYFPLKESWWL